MIYKLDAEQLDLIRDVIRPGMIVNCTHGFGEVVKCNLDSISISLDGKVKDLVMIGYDEVVPVLKGFQHLGMVDAFKVFDIITNNIDVVEYKPNFNFIPSYIEVTEELKKEKLQIFNNFDIVYCDNLLINAGPAYSYLRRRGYDIGGLAKMGLAIIDPTPYGITIKH